MIGETAQLILDRMRSNPEEFFRGSSQRWHWLFHDSTRELLTEEEVNALQAEYNIIRRKEFHHRVLETILQENRDLRIGPQEDYTYAGTIIGGSQLVNGGINGFANPVAAGLRIGDTVLTEDKLTALLGQLQKTQEAKSAS